MTLWDSVSKSDPESLKEVKYGARQFTAIDAYSQIKRATALWGPMGGSWGVSDGKFHLFGGKLVYQAKMHHTDGDQCRIIEIQSCINVDKQDAVKCVVTDAITKGLSWWGFDSEIFSGSLQWNGHKYVDTKEPPKSPPKKKEKVEKYSKMCPSIIGLYKKYKEAGKTTEQWKDLLVSMDVLGKLDEGGALTQTEYSMLETNVMAVQDKGGETFTEEDDG
jgi:hypothetical protein